MCGIIGYIGKENATPILLEGLRRESYRGYDSSGIVVFGKEAQCVKAVGKLEKLEEKLRSDAPEGNIGIGHCLTPDTLIQMADGRNIPISEVQNGQEVLSYNLEVRKVERSRVKVFQHVSPSYIYSIRTPFGEVRCTNNHQMFVSVEGGISTKKASALAKKDYLVVPLQLNIQGKKIRFKKIYAKRYFRVADSVVQTIRSIMAEKVLRVPAVARTTGVSSSYMEHILANDRNFREDELNKVAPFFSIEFPSAHFIPQNTIHGKFITLPEESSSELMQIIGYFLGDGTAQPRTVRFKDIATDTLEAYQKLIKKVFGVKGRVVPQNDTAAWLLEVNSVYLSKWLRENVVLHKEKFLEALGQLPRDEVAAFLRGIFDAEGCVGLGSGQVIMSNTNRKLVKVVQLLCLRLGIRASLHRQDRSRDSWSDSYTIYVSDYHFLETFRKEVGFTSQEKRQKLQSLMKRKHDNLSYSRKKHLASNVSAERILEIRRIPSDTPYLYDLEVKQNSNFFANGLLSHNSRWATHGNVSEENAHPHWDCKGNIFVVHNGIIENYQVLKEKLEAKGHKFLSQTDTEVLPHLIEHFFQGNLEEAVQKTLQLVKGTYGIAVIAKEDPEKIIAARLSSPLVLSINSSGGFVASDPAALISHSNKMIFLDDREVAVIQPDKFLVTDIYNKPREKEITELEWTLEEAQKGGYPHFMLKEIMEQPLSVENSLRGRVLFDEGKARLGGLQEVEEKLRGVLRLNIIACGTSYYAGLVGEYMFEEYAGIPTEVDIGSEFRYRKAIVDKDTAFIFISQSGETADTLGALKEVKEKGGMTLGIVNVVGSSVARETEAGVYNHAGPEVGVASTKAFTSQLTILALFTLFLGRQRGMSLVMGQRIAKEITRVPELVEKVLETSKEVEKLAFKYKGFSDFLYIGRKYNYPVVLEGALKLKEISYIHAEGYGAGEMKHGPIALIDKNFPTIAICPSDSVYEKMVSNIQEIKARNGPVIALATEGNEEIKKIADDVIYIPKTLEMLTPILAVIPLQLFAYYMGVLRGYDVDKPRNLAKSVTVE